MKIMILHKVVLKINNELHVQPCMILKGTQVLIILCWITQARNLASIIGVTAHWGIPTLCTRSV